MPSASHSDDRAWAADLLGVGPDDPAAAKAAFFRRLPAAGFVPPPDQRAAVRLLADTRAPAASGSAPDPARFSGIAAEQRKAVEKFADRFWQLEPDERRERWQGLLDRCAADPLLSARLRRLEPGLAVRAVPADAAGGRAAELAGFVQTLFVLRPADQATCRQELLAALRTPLGAWRDAVVELREWYPDLAALDPTFLATVRDTGRLVRFREQSRRIAAALRAEQDGGTAARVADNEDRPARRRRASRPAPTDGWSVSPRGLTFTLIALVVLIVRLATALSGGSSAPPSGRPANEPSGPDPTTAPWNQPKLNRPNGAPLIPGAAPNGGRP